MSSYLGIFFSFFLLMMLTRVCSIRHFRRVWPTTMGGWYARYASSDTSNTPPQQIINDREPAELATRAASLQLFLARWGLEVAFQRGDHGERIRTTADSIGSTAVVTDIIDFMTEKVS
jgi:hypothetical protein